MNKKDLWFSVNFRGNRSYLIRSNLINIILLVFIYRKQYLTSFRSMSHFHTKFEAAIFLAEFKKVRYEKVIQNPNKALFYENSIVSTGPKMEGIFNVAVVSSQWNL